MNSATLLSRSTRRVALVGALSVAFLLTAIHIAGAQQQTPLPAMPSPVSGAAPNATVNQPQLPLPATPSRPARDAWDYLSQVATPLGALVAFGAAIITVSLSVRSWKWTYFTREWSSLLQFIQPQAKFMDRSLTAEYKTKFTGDDAMKYEIIARLCIGYLDDLYFLGSKRLIRTWFRGSVKLFAGTHRKWLEDHKESYDQRFYEFILRELDRR